MFRFQPFILQGVASNAWILHSKAWSLLFQWFFSMDSPFSRFKNMPKQLWCEECVAHLPGRWLTEEETPCDLRWIESINLKCHWKNDKPFFLWGRPERHVTVYYTLRRKDSFSLISLSDCWAGRPSMGHYITNPNIAFLWGNPSKLPSICCLFDFLPRWVPFNDPCPPG